ncbi:probable glutathione S-transferase [Helianthus annuus]|uniref:probable glutathione S-transferase n=1 Tax=Helianthus annuus TaxID=4232 RepID=UPI000B8F9E9F|nr:probable glutathione S-transferase [Helianthus annuus]
MIITCKGEEMKKRVEEFLGYLKVLERVLGEKQSFLHDGTLINFGIKIHCPKLLVWATKCMKRESVSKSLADSNKIYESLIAYRKKIGVEE